MSQKAFTRIAALIFTLMALGHLTRILRGVDFSFGEWTAPMWISWVAIVLMAFLAYEGFRLSRK